MVTPAAPEPRCHPAWCTLPAPPASACCASSHFFPLLVSKSYLAAPQRGRVARCGGIAALSSESRLLTTFAWVYFCPRASPWVPTAFGLQGLVQEQRKFMPTSCQGAGKSRRPGDPDYFIFLRLSQVFGSPVSWFHVLTHLSVSSSLFLADTSPVQVSANIPRKSKPGLSHQCSCQVLGSGDLIWESQLSQPVARCL